MIFTLRLYRRIGWALFALFAPVFALLAVATFTTVPDDLLRRERHDSVRFVDRDGALLREVRADDASRARFIGLDEAGENVARAILAAEDQRFALHPGVDPIAVGRAIVADVGARRIVSGASTLTMQLACLVRPHARRSALGKVTEMALAIRIEEALGKRAILEEYMNRAPFGPSLRGVDAASRYYFDKPPGQLSLAEAAALAAVPRGPSLYSMTKHPERVVRRRDRILARMRDAGWIDADAFERAVREPLVPRAERGSFGAPHLVEALRQGRLDGAPRGAAEVRTTIARDLQAEAEAAALVAIAPLAKRHATAASVVVIDNATGDVLAYVGSPDFGDDARGGQNDGVRALRQPGSTLKPFVYGLAMERAGMTAATVIDDVDTELPVATGTYSPRNYDERFHGPVRLREALANSFNVPAVRVADEIGAASLLERLHALGFASLDRGPDFYGPALALGDGEVTLLDLAAAYTTLARSGIARPRRFVLPPGPAPDAVGEGTRVMPADVADVITDILADRHARLASFGERSVLELPFDVAAKTGTSKGFRDNWTVGYTREVTVGAWVGNFDGSPMGGVSGVTGAGPLFRAVMIAAMRGRSAAPLRLAASADLVQVEVCPLSGARPGPACPHAVREWLPRSRADLDRCTMHEKVEVDVRNGLRAGPGCPHRFVEARTFEAYDGRLAAWSRGARRETAPREFSPWCPGGVDAASSGSLRALRVGYPRDGATFAIDPDRPAKLQTVAVRVEAPGGAGAVRLRVDGAIAARLDPPYVARWPLARGTHVLVAEAPGLAPSDPVRVTVE